MTLKHISILLFPLFVTVSCDENCNDCGAYTSGSYTVDNKRGVNMKLLFFRNNRETEILLSKDQTVLLHQLSVVSQEGVLRVEPISYDSLQIVSSSPTENYDRTNCESVSNLLCEQNYTLNTSKDDIGNTFNKYVIELE